MISLWSSPMRHAASGPEVETRGMGLEAGKMSAFSGRDGDGLGRVEMLAQRMFNPLSFVAFSHAQPADLRTCAGAATVGGDAGRCFNEGGEGVGALRLVRLLYPFGREENFHIAQTMMRTPRFTTHRRKSPAKKKEGRAHG